MTTRVCKITSQLRQDNSKIDLEHYLLEASTSMFHDVHVIQCQNFCMVLTFRMHQAILEIVFRRYDLNLMK